MSRHPEVAHSDPLACSPHAGSLEALIWSVGPAARSRAQGAQFACVPLPRLQGVSLPSVLPGDPWLWLCPEGAAEAEAEALQQADPGGSLAHPGDGLPPRSLGNVVCSSVWPCHPGNTHRVCSGNRAWPSAPSTAGPSPTDPLKGGRAAGHGTDSPARCKPCPGSCGMMPAGWWEAWCWGAQLPLSCGPGSGTGRRPGQSCRACSSGPVASGCSGPLSVCPQPHLCGGRSGREAGVSRWPSPRGSGPACAAPTGLGPPGGAR